MEYKAPPSLSRYDLHRYPPQVWQLRSKQRPQGLLLGAKQLWLSRWPPKGGVNPMWKLEPAGKPVKSSIK